MTAARLLDGKTAADKVLARVRADAADFTTQAGRTPQLDVILVGDDHASEVYTHRKACAAVSVGIRSVRHHLPGNASEADLLNLVDGLNASKLTDGLLVQLPLPGHIDAGKVVAAVSPLKDVDGLHPLNVGLLSAGQPEMVPCTARACMHLLAEAGVELEGANAVVVGHSSIVGRPVAQMLLEQHATVTVAHAHTRDLELLCRNADVLVVAVGKPGLIPGRWVKPGAAVVDVGINRTEEGGLVGDVDFDGACERAGWITPVPGGVGPVTVAFLLDNTVRAARMRAPLNS